MEKAKFETTEEEREIIRKLNQDDIGRWIKSGEYWKVFREVINATKIYLGKQKVVKEEKTE